MILELSLSIATIRARLILRGLGREACAIFKNKYAPFLHAGPWDYDVDVARSEGECKPHAAKIEQTGTSESRIVLRGLEGFIDWPRQKVQAKLFVDTIHPIENLMRALISEALMQRGGALIHSTGILKGDQAYVFAGKSEAGKTTLARKAGFKATLSDELIAIVPDSDAFRAYATPFWGEMGAGELNADAKLTALCLLDGKDEQACRRIDEGEAVQRLLSVMLCYSGQSPRAVEICRRIVSTTSVLALRSEREEPIDSVIARVNALLSS